MYKKHRAFGVKPNAIFYLQSSLNIKFGVYRRKDKSKIFIFSHLLRKVYDLAQLKKRKKKWKL